MEIKDLIGLTLICFATLTCVAAASVSFRLRDAAFFCMTAAAVITHKLDINFASHFWYRGTTRGLEYSLVDILSLSVLASSLLAPRPGASRWYWPAGLGPLIVFILFAGFSVLISEPKIYGVFELSKMLRGLVFFLAAALYVRSERELSILVVALACAVGFEGLLSVKQRVLEGMFRVTGSLDHPNSLSMYLCLVAPLFVAAANSTLPRPVRWIATAAILPAALGILFTISRAGIPVFALVMLGATAWCVSWRITASKVAVVSLICMALAGMLYKSWDLLKARFGESTLAEEYLDEDVEGRGYYLRLARVIMEDRFWGVGLNNWSYWVSKSYGARLGTPYEDYDDLTYIPSKEILPSINYAAPAHNLGALTVGEIGVPGLLLFAILWMRWFQMGVGFLWRRTTDALHRLGVGLFFGTCGIFLQSLTEWTYRQTHIFLTFHILLGTLAGLYHLKRQAGRIPLKTVDLMQSREEEQATAIMREKPRCV